MPPGGRDGSSGSRPCRPVGPLVGGGATGGPGDSVARALVLRLGDFLEPGWRERPGTAGPGEAGGDEGLGDLLASRFPEEDVSGLAESAAFVRGQDLLAFSVALVTAGAAAGARAFEVVASAGFASSFAAAVEAGVALDEGDATFLGSVTSPLALGPGPGDAARHRTSFGAATPAAVVPAHVDLVALHVHDRVSLLWLASSPDPFPAAELDHVVARARARLSGPPPR